MPSFALPSKVQLVEKEGATAVLVDGSELATRAHELADHTDALFIHPFGSGERHGRPGHRRPRDFRANSKRRGSPLDVLLVPVGGGGLVSGIASIAAEISPSTRVIPVEPERAGDLHESSSAGRITPWDRAVTATTAADGLRAPAVGELPWSIIQQQISESLTVSEESIFAAMRIIAAETNAVVEPSGAVAAAAVLQHAEQFAGLSVAAIVSGSNVAVAQFAEQIA